MTTINFVPPPLGQAPFQFGLTLDGQPYTATIRWNTFGQRWYITLVSSDNQIVFTLPVIGSPVAILLTSMVWYNGIVTATSRLPHGLSYVQPALVDIIGFVPDAYNGVGVQILVNSPTTFTYPLAADPGPPTTSGQMDSNVNIAAGYFATSKLIFREAAQQFEIRP